MIVLSHFINKCTCFGNHAHYSQKNNKLIIQVHGLKRQKTHRIVRSRFLFTLRCLNDCVFSCANSLYQIPTVIVFTSLSLFCQLIFKSTETRIRHFNKKNKINKVQLNNSCHFQATENMLWVLVRGSLHAMESCDISSVCQSTLCQRLIRSAGPTGQPPVI